jgi:hypothetical protein
VPARMARLGHACKLPPRQLAPTRRTSALRQMRGGGMGVSDRLEVTRQAIAKGSYAMAPDDLPYADSAARALAAADAEMFAPANIARIVKKTGISIQTVNEVIRELRTEDG